MGRRSHYRRFYPFAAGLTGLLLLVGFHVQLADAKSGSLQKIHRFLASVDDNAFDLMFRLRGDIQPTGQVILVAIDEKSLEAPELGQFPWPRHTFATLLRKIHAGRPKAIGLDIVFAEADRTSPSAILGQHPQYLKAPLTREESRALDWDVSLAAAIQETGAVAGYFFLPENFADGKTCAPPFPSWNFRIAPEGRSQEEADIPAMNGVTLNVDAVEDAMHTEGFLNLSDIDASGVIRKIPLLMKHKGVLYPSIALEMLRTGSGETDVNLTLFPGETANVARLHVGSRLIRTDHECAVVLNYRGESGRIRHVSAIDILRDSVGGAEFAGKYVLIGAVAIGLHDTKVTPFSQAMPGPEIQATAIDNMLAGDALLLDRVDANGKIRVALAVAGAALVLVLCLSSAAWGGITFILLTLLLLAADYHLIFLCHQLIGPVYPCLALALLYMLVTLFRFLFIDQESRFIRNAFSMYLSPRVIDELSKNPDRLSLGGEQRVLTVLFTDIRGFTTISETMTSHELSHFLNDYLSEMADIILKERGTVDKFIGDAIMALWGAPLDDPQHARNSLRAAWRMVNRLRDLAPIWKAQGRPPFLIGVGINSGDMVVGNMGSSSRFDYTVIGDNVNLASRLEGLTKVYGTDILISEATYRLAGEEFFCVPIDQVRVKGKKEAIRVYEVIAEGAGTSAQQEAARKFTDAFAAYLARHWDRAQEKFTALEMEHPRPLHQIFLERIAAAKEKGVPEDWDGAWTMATK